MITDNAAIVFEDEIIILDKASRGRNEARNEYRGCMMMADTKPKAAVYKHIRGLLIKKYKDRNISIKSNNMLEAVRLQSYLKTMQDIIKEQGPVKLREYILQDMKKITLLPYDLELYLYQNNLNDIKDMISPSSSYELRIEN